MHELWLRLDMGSSRSTIMRYHRNLHNIEESFGGLVVIRSLKALQYGTRDG